MDHNLTRHFPALRDFSSTAALEASPIYARLQTEITRVLDAVVIKNSATSPATPTASLRATAWNVERGNKFDGILRTLDEHPVIGPSDVLILTELDYGMARSGNRDVAGELAKALNCNYAFAPSYISLVKGSGLEAQVAGEDSHGIHGNGILSRWPILSAHSVPMPNGKDLMRGKEKRLGQQRAVIATIDHPLGPVHVACLHLDCHSSRQHRADQMRIVLDYLDGLEPRLPAIVAGDWNTSTFNTQHAIRAFLGSWRKFFMGVRNVIENHYPHPDRKFERALFDELTRRGYRYRDVNEVGGCTFHYDVDD